MKKQTSLFIIAACLVVIGCHYHGRNTSIAFSESERYYSMKARFSEERTREVERYMDKRMSDHRTMSFVNTTIDGQLSFDDRSSFYIKKYPGYLQIKLDKNQNSPDTYLQIRDMCQGIKRLLANNDMDQ
jgi:hypothetical protein